MERLEWALSAGLMVAPVLLGTLSRTCQATESEGAQRTDRQRAVPTEIKVVPQGFALVELFTSQGCSSCPPADQLLARLASHARRHRMPVYCLSYHVDYWNKLGWNDPFSHPHCTQRQRQYMAALNEERVYTPQMIVNGHIAFVGSSVDRAKLALADALGIPSSVQIQLKAVREGRPAVIDVEVSVRGNVDNAVFNLVIAQPQAQTSVENGENAGRELTHVNVVRDLRSLTLDQDQRGRGTLALPAELAEENVLLIAFLQDQKTGHVMGAVQKELFVPEIE